MDPNEIDIAWCSEAISNEFGTAPDKSRELAVQALRTYFSKGGNPSCREEMAAVIQVAVGAWLKQPEAQ